MIKSNFGYNNNLKDLQYPDKTISTNKGNCLDISFVVRDLSNAIGIESSLANVDYGDYNEKRINRIGHSFPIFKDEFNQWFIFNYLTSDSQDKPTVLYAAFNGPFISKDELLDVAKDAFACLLTGSDMYHAMSFNSAITKEASYGMIMNTKSLKEVDQILKDKIPMTQATFFSKIKQCEDYYKMINADFERLIYKHGLKEYKTTAEQAEYLSEVHKPYIEFKHSFIKATKEGVNKMKEIFRKFKKG